MSKRQRKRLEREELRQQGIQGLIRTSYGKQIMLAETSPLFCIDGTVAHLHCRINALHNDSHVVDENHHSSGY